MRMLVIHMIKSGESLENVVDQLIEGKRITNIQQQIRSGLDDSRVSRSPTSRSPSRKSVSPMRASSPRLSMNKQQTSLLRKRTTVTPGAVKQIVKQKSYVVGPDESVTESEGDPNYLMKKDTIFQNLRETFQSKVIQNYTSPTRKSVIKKM